MRYFLYGFSLSINDDGKHLTRLRYWLLVLCCLPFLTNALVFSVSSDNYVVVGHVTIIQARTNDTLSKIAQRYDIGHDAIEKANPQFVPGQKIAKNSLVIIPAVFILPGNIRQGIVIDLAQKILLFYSKKNQQVFVYPIGIGKEGYATPLADMQVTGRKQDPEWTPPPSARAAAKERGVILPATVPPGPTNPLGPYVIYTNLHGYWIHGTSQPDSVGRSASFGCIRMYSKDIEQLFNHVHRGVPIKIISKTFRD